MKNKLKLTRFVVAKLNNLHLIYGGGEDTNQESLSEEKTFYSCQEKTCECNTSPTTSGDPEVTKGGTRGIGL